MNRTLASPNPPSRESLLGRLDERGIVRQAEIVVRREIQDRAPVDVDERPLRAFEQTLAFPESGGADCFELRGEPRGNVTVHDVSPFVASGPPASGAHAAT